MSDIIERFEAKYFVAPDGCWLWTANAHAQGYGKIKIAKKTMLAHRVSYELYVGKIAKGLHIDHLCRQPACVNPYHLEPVTKKENTLRGVGPSAQNAKKTHCKRGHELTSQNMYSYSTTRRICVACSREQDSKRKRAYRAKRKLEIVNV